MLSQPAKEDDAARATTMKAKETLPIHSLSERDFEWKRLFQRVREKKKRRMSESGREGGERESLYFLIVVDVVQFKWLHMAVAGILMICLCARARAHKMPFTGLKGSQLLFGLAAESCWTKLRPKNKQISQCTHTRHRRRRRRRRWKLHHVFCLLAKSLISVATELICVTPLLKLPFVLLGFTTNNSCYSIRFTFVYLYTSYIFQCMFLYPGSILFDFG